MTILLFVFFFKYEVSPIIYFWMGHFEDLSYIDLYSIITTQNPSNILKWRFQPISQSIVSRISKSIFINAL